MERVFELLSYSSFSKEMHAYSISSHALPIAFLLNYQNPDLVIPDSELPFLWEAVEEFPELEQYYTELIHLLPLRRKYFKLKLASAPDAGSGGSGGGGGGGGLMPPVKLDVSEKSSIREIVEYGKTKGLPPDELQKIMSLTLEGITSAEALLEIKSPKRAQAPNLSKYVDYIELYDAVVDRGVNKSLAITVHKCRLNLLELLRKSISENLVQADGSDKESTNDELNDDEVEDDDQSDLPEYFIQLMKDNDEFIARRPKPTTRVIELRSKLGDNDGIPLPVIDVRYFAHMSDLHLLAGFSARAFEIADELRKHLSLYNEFLLVVVGLLIKQNTALQSVQDEWATFTPLHRQEQCYGLDKRFYIHPLPRIYMGLIEKHLHGEKSVGSFVQDYIDELVFLDPCDFKGETEFALKFNSILRKLELVNCPFHHPVERFLRCYQNGTSGSSKRSHMVRKVSTTLHETYTTMRRNKENPTLQYMIDLAKTTASTPAAADARSTDSSNGQNRGNGNSKRRNSVSSKPDSNPPNAAANSAAAAKPKQTDKGAGKGKGGKGKGKGNNNSGTNYCYRCKKNHEPPYGDKCTAQRQPTAQANAAAAEAYPPRDDEEEYELFRLFKQKQDAERRGAALPN